MKKIALLLFSLALPGVVMAHSNFINDVNTSCGYDVFAADECIGCHLADDDLKSSTYEKDLYLSDGTCAFCTEVTSCNSAPPTEAELYINARATTKAYFERLFKDFTMALQAVGGSSNPTAFADVFPKCPEIAPLIGSEFSRDTGYLVRRVTTRTRNSRNMPDDWELEQLKKFEDMAADGKPRSLLEITKPDGIILPTKEFEAFDVMKEGVGNDSEYYFRYMRSITVPPLASGLPCLKCHGTNSDLGAGVVEAVQEFYPHDMAMGYKAGDIRAAWTIKIPLAAKP